MTSEIKKGHNRTNKNEKRMFHGMPILAWFIVWPRINYEIGGILLTSQVALYTTGSVEMGLEI